MTFGWIKSPWEKLGLAARLIILSGLALLAGGVMQLVVTAQSEVANVRTDFNEQLESELQLLGILLTEQVVIGDYATVQRIFDTRLKHQNMGEISYTGKQGENLQAVNKSVPKLAPAWFAQWASLSGVQGKRDIVVGTKNYGQLVVRFTEVPTLNRIWQLFQVQLLILLVGFLFFVVVTAILIRCGLAPLRDFSRHAEALSQGDYSARISIVGTPEIQVAAKAFNNMSSRIEELLTSLNAALAEQNTVLDNAVVGISFVKDRHIVWCNRKHEEIFGYTKEEIVQLPTERLYASHMDYLRLGEEAYPAMLAQGSYSGEYRLKRKEGSLLWGTLSGKLVNPDDPQRGSIWIVEDVTTRREAQENLKQLNETLEERVQEEAAKNREKDLLLIQQSRLAAMGEMIGNIAHQWRQPINALALVLANIKDAYEFNELDKTYLDKSVNTGQQLIQKMSTTIDDFRNFFKPNTEKIRFRLCDATMDALGVVADTFKNLNIELISESCHSACFVNGYPNEYSQVVLNALANAKEAIVARGVAGKIWVKFVINDKDAVLLVQDNGGGIPEKIIGKVFDPYFTTKEMGTGIGLYMSKMIMEKMGGTISIHNIEGGAEARISLPRAESVLS